MITIVTGPPCSGKSTYVESVRKPGDFVWDYDQVARTLFQTKRDEISDAQARLLNEICGVVIRSLEFRNTFPNVFIILTSLATARLVAERLKGHVKVMATEKHECLRRLRETRPVGSHAVIEKVIKDWR